MYLITTWFATFLWSKDGADKVHRADNDPGAVAHRLERLGRLDILEEERELAEGLRSEGKVDDPNLKVCEPRLEPLGEVVAEPSDLDIDVLAQEWGYGPQLLHEAVLRLGRDTARQAQGLDLQLLQAVAASDELVEVANLLGERVAQWEGLSLPEVSLTMRPAALAKAISSAPDRETLAQEREVDLQETLGVEADPTGRTALEGLARLTTETAVEQDDDALEAYLEGNEPDMETLQRCIRKGTLSGDFVPVFCGSAFKNKGVQPLLDGVVDYLPAPTDLAAMVGSHPDRDEEIVRNSSDDEPFAALAFKVMTDPFVGSLTFVRVYSGVLESGSTVLNSVKGTRERIGRMLLMHANSREDVKEARAGDILALCGLKNSTTGDTLSNPSNVVVLERMEFPDPVIEVAVEPKTKQDQEKMGAALKRLADEDPSFRVTSDNESGQTVIKGMGELHLEILVDRMKREFKVDANVGAPQVAYRETVGRPADLDYTHKKQTGGSGQFARIKLELEPGEPGSGEIFDSKIVGGNVPKEYIPGVEKGITSVASGGVLAGFPLIDFKITLVDGAYHDVDSSVMAFEIASRAAFRELVMSAKPKLLEPIMRVEVVTPEEYVGDVMGDLNRRRGHVTGTEIRGNAQVIGAMVPLANMFGYVNNLRSATQGRAQFTMHFDHYEQVPQAVSDEVRAKLA